MWKNTGCFKRNREYENTLIFFTTDHGLPFPMMKCNLYDDGTGVSFILRYPGMPRVHCISDALLSQIDVFPTLCDILNMEKPNWLSGSSFLPVITGEEEEIREAVYAEINYHVAYSKSDLSERRKINILYGGRMVTIKFHLPILMTVCQKKYSMKTDILRRNL